MDRSTWTGAREPEPVERSSVPSLTEPGDPMSGAQLERAAGVLVGHACGDALAVSWDAGNRTEERPELTGRDVLDQGVLGHDCGAWSETVDVAAQVAVIAATGADLGSRRGRAAVARVLDRSDGGAAGHRRSTAGLLRTLRSGARRGDPPSGSSIAVAHSGATDRALATSTVIGLTALFDADRTAATARVVAGRCLRGDADRDGVDHERLTLDACVLWSEAIRVAVVEGRFDLGGGVELLPAERREQWRGWVDAASTVDARAQLESGQHESRAVSAVQTAWKAIITTPVPPEEPDRDSYSCVHFQHALQAAVLASGPHSPASALAGGLLAARWGRSAVPMRWVRRLHGAAGLRARDLVRLGVLTSRAGQPVRKGWPTVPHVTLHNPIGPALRLRTDPGTWVGGIGSAGQGIDAVVSLCALGALDVPATGVAPENHLEAWLISSPDPEDNPNLRFALDDAARSVLDLREEGHEVLVQCTRSRHRTPMVAVQYLMLRGVRQRRARQEVRAVYAEGWGPGATEDS